MKTLFPAKNVAACPDCDGKVRLLVRSKSVTDWQCRNNVCLAAGGIFADGKLFVRTRYRVIA